jgi:hypothetical protein
MPVLPASPPPPKIVRFMTWHRRVLGICLIVFAFEIGLFLLVYPWLRHWGMSWVPLHSPLLAKIWMSRYLRGCISGLGLLNIYVAFAETARQIRSLF